MDRYVKCANCAKVFKARARGSLPIICSTCRPAVYKERYKGRYYHYKKRNRETFPASELIRGMCLERDNFRCVNCGSESNLHVHHRDGNSYDKVREKANNKLENLLTLCHKCHLTKYHLPMAKSRKTHNLIMYHLKYINMSDAALGRVFKMSRERVGQLLGRRLKRQQKRRGVAKNKGG